MVWRHSWGLSQTCPGVWLLRATGPASVHRGRIGPAAARGADWSSPRASSDSHRLAQDGDYRVAAWLVSFWTHTHTHIHALRKRWDDLGKPAAEAQPVKIEAWALTRLSHCLQNTRSQPRVMSRYKTTLFSWQRGNCELKGHWPKASSTASTATEDKNWPSLVISVLRELW